MCNQLAELGRLMMPEEQWLPLVHLVAELVGVGCGFDDSVAAVLAYPGGCFILWELARISFVVLLDHEKKLVWRSGRLAPI